MKSYVIKIDIKSSKKIIGILKPNEKDDFNLKNVYPVNDKIINNHVEIELNLLNVSEEFEYWETVDREGHTIYREAMKEFKNKDELKNNLNSSYDSTINNEMN